MSESTIKQLKERVAYLESVFMKTEGIREDGTLGPTKERLIDLLATEQKRVSDLESALEPFAHFARKWNAKPIRGLANELYATHMGEDGAIFRLSDCQRALELLDHPTDQRKD